MKLLLDIKDSKATDLLQILRTLSYVTTSHISDEKVSLINEMDEAIDSLKFNPNQGKYKDRLSRGH
jgi:hypothetical protein